jgi:hypothetical protein
MLRVPGSGTPKTPRLVLLLEGFALWLKRALPPICTSPLLKAPVVKLTEPRFAPTALPNEINVGPVRDNPFELPETTPPALLTSMLFAKATKGTARVRTARHTNLLHIDLPPTTKVPNQGHSIRENLALADVARPAFATTLVDKAAFKHCHKMYEGLDRIDSVLSRSCNRT